MLTLITEESFFAMSSAPNPAPTVKEPVQSVIAGAVANDKCSVCGDTFELFYNDDDDEWHLRDCVRRGNKNYHPACLDHCKVDITY
jgi:hypothetical protein